MAKRGPSSDLNDRNWDDEEEPEEAGMFAQASKDVIEHRVIKRAKRTRVAGDNADSSSSAFSGFTGLGAKVAGTNTDTFSSFKKLDGDSSSNSKPIVFGGTSSINGNEDQKLKCQGNTKDTSSYLGCLKSLNESVLAWIKQHVDSNPYIILSPVFKDYEKYLDVIQSKKFPGSGNSSARDDGSINVVTDSGANTSSKVITSVLATPASKPNDDVSDEGRQSEASKAKAFSFGQTSTESTKAFSFGQTKTEPSKPFSFGQTPAESSKPFMFGQTTAQSSVSGGFSFTPSSGGSTGAAVKFTSASSTPATGFSFSQSSSGASSLFGKSTLSSSGSTNSSQGLFSIGKTASQEQSSTEGSQDGGEKDNEEYEPPKPEVKEIVEADALYSKRCKLYYQKDGQWVDRGVGNLHLKPVADNKTQLLVRADTNLGNILLNIMLSSSMPVSRQGKNNVVLVTVANPPIKTGDEENTPVPLLIRVKTEEEADDLLKIIDERKKIL